MTLMTDTLNIKVTIEKKKSCVFKHVLYEHAEEISLKGLYFRLHPGSSPASLFLWLVCQLMQ